MLHGEMRLAYFKYKGSDFLCTAYYLCTRLLTGHFCDGFARRKTYRSQLSGSREKLVLLFLCASPRDLPDSRRDWQRRVHK